MRESFRNAFGGHTSSESGGTCRVLRYQKGQSGRNGEKVRSEAYYDYEQMLDNEKLDAIHLCLPQYLHSKVEDSAEGLITYKNGVKYGFYCMNNYGTDEPSKITLYCGKALRHLFSND